MELSNGQYRDDVLLHLGDHRPPVHFINRMGGMLVEVGAIIEKVQQILRDQK